MLSVHAGFRDDELSALWPAPRGRLAAARIRGRARSATACAPSVDGARRRRRRARDRRQPTGDRDERRCTLAGVDVDAVIVGAGPAGARRRSCWRAPAGRSRWSRSSASRAARSAASASRRATCRCSMRSGIGAAIDALAGPPLRRVALMRGDRTVVADLPASRPARASLGPRARPRDARHAAARAGARGRRRDLAAVVGAGARRRCRRLALSAARRSTRQRRSRCARPSRSPRTARGSGCRRSGRPIAAGARPATCSPSRPTSATRACRRACCRCSSFDGGYGGMVVADGGVTTLACCIRRDRLDALPARVARRCAPATRSRPC